MYKHFNHTTGKGSMKCFHSVDTEEGCTDYIFNSINYATCVIDVFLKQFSSMFVSHFCCIIKPDQYGSP